MHLGSAKSDCSSSTAATTTHAEKRGTMNRWYKWSEILWSEDRKKRGSVFSFSYSPGVLIDTLTPLYSRIIEITRRVPSMSVAELFLQVIRKFLEVHTSILIMCMFGCYY